MDIEKFKDRLGDDYEPLRAYVDEITAKRDAAVRESIDGRKALKSRLADLEAAQHRVLEKLGIDSLDDLDSLPEPKGQAEAVRQFEAKLRRMERDLADAVKSRDEALAKHKSALLDAALEKSLSAHEWLDRDVASMLVRNGIAWEDDKPFYQAGDRAVPLDDGVKIIAQTKPHLLKSAGAGGSGYRPGGTPGDGAKTITRVEFDALAHPQRAAFVKNGGKVVDPN